MRRRSIIAAVLAVVTAGVCLRLGLWQLERHDARRAYNERVAVRSLAEPVALERVRADSTARFRRVEASGVFDYEHELVLANRTSRGSPGVHVITPLVLSGGQRAVLVNRGWVYSPDASRVELARWREGDTVDVHGYLELLDQGSRPGVRAQVAPGVWYRLDSEALAADLPYELVDVQLIAVEVAPAAGTAPARLGTPQMERGPHLSYAFQWFAFGAIALIGVAALIRHDARRL